MADNFNPKISYKMAGMFIDSKFLSRRKPWDYLDDWQQSDRGYDPLELEYINERMQQQYPGPYKVVKKKSPHGRFIYYVMEFNSPAEETMYKLKWS